MKVLVDAILFAKMKPAIHRQIIATVSGIMIMRTAIWKNSEAILVGDGKEESVKDPVIMKTIGSDMVYLISLSLQMAVR